MPIPPKKLWGVDSFNAPMMGKLYHLPMKTQAFIFTKKTG